MKKYLELPGGGFAGPGNLETGDNRIAVFSGKLSAKGKCAQPHRSEHDQVNRDDVPARFRIVRGSVKVSRKAGGGRWRSSSPRSVAGIWRTAQYWDCDYDDSAFDGLCPPESSCWAALDDAGKRLHSWLENDDGSHEDIISFYSFEYHCGEGDAKQASRMLGRIRADARMRESLQGYLDCGLERLMDARRIGPGHLAVLEMLLREGAGWEPVSRQKAAWQEDGREHWRGAPFLHFLLQNYRPEDGAEQVPRLADEFFLPRYREAAGVCIDALEVVIRAIRTGEQGILLEIDHLPLRELPVSVYGLEIHAGEGGVSIFPVNRKNRKSYIAMRAPSIEGTDKELAGRYLPPFLIPRLEELAEVGALDSISNGYMSIALSKHPEPLLKRVTHQQRLDERAQKLREALNHLMHSENWSANCAALEWVVAALVHGNGIMEPDKDTALHLLLRHLYSGHEAAEELAAQLYPYYSHYANSGRWEYEWALWQWANLDFENALRRMCGLAGSGDPLAARQLEQWLDTLYNREGRIPGKEVNRWLYGKQLEREFYLAFRREDLFLQTDYIIAQADLSHTVRVRFLSEGATAYAQVLGFLVNLMEKGYARLFGDFALSVRFAGRPLFLSELRGQVPHTPCHAFFARAVRYERLHPSIRRFAELALPVCDYSFHSEEGIGGSLAGAFACCALALWDIRYISYAGLYARCARAQQGGMQLRLRQAIIKKYGVVPQVVPAIFDLVVCSEQGVGCRLPKELYQNPHNLTAVIEHCTRGHYNRRQTRCMVLRYMEQLMKPDVRENLRTLRRLTQRALLPENENCYIVFYNFYRAAAAKINREDYGEDLALRATEGREGHRGPPQESPSCVVTLEEARQRGLEPDDMVVFRGRYAVLFTPACEINPQVIEHMKVQWESLKKLEETCTMISGRHYVRFGKWVVDLTGAPYRYGVILYDGKQKPEICYGLLDFAPLLAYFYRQPNGLLEGPGQRYKWTAVMDCPTGTPFDLEYPETEALFQRVRESMWGKRYHRAGKLLRQLRVEDGRYYIAGLIYQCKLAALARDAGRKKALYRQLAEHCPEHAFYWEEKFRQQSYIG